MKQKSKYSVLFHLLSLLGSCYFFSACNKAPDFSDTPSISFKSIAYIKDPNPQEKYDKLEMQVYFQDGDGDLGLSPNEKADSINFVGDIFIKDKTGNNYTLFQGTNNFLVIRGRFPRLNPDSTSRPLSGVITYDLNSVGFRSTTLPSLVVYGRTIKAKVYIKDRAGNQSNVAESNPVLIE